MSSTLRRATATVAAASALGVSAAAASGCGSGEEAASAAGQTAAPAEDRATTSGDTGKQSAGSIDQGLEEARRAALDEIGGGEVISVEDDDDGGYDVDVIRGDEEITVDLDEAFRVVGVETEQRNEVSGDGADRALEAALRETGGGEVISVEDDDGGYDVDIIRGPDEVNVDLDEAFRVVGVETEQRHGDD